VIKFVSDLHQWFSLGTLVASTNKTDRHDIIEILLKVALNPINQTKLYHIFLTKGQDFFSNIRLEKNMIL
jgi:hypothetical protein